MRWSLVLLAHQYQAAGLASAPLASKQKAVPNKQFPSLVLNEELSCQAVMVNVLYLYTVFK
jgi:hypothetical protein